MRRSFLLPLLAICLLWPGVSLAQSGDGGGDGGLHVSNGGSVGYVGGSGSISGTVRGPGGSGGSGTAPSRQAVTPDDEPSAVQGGTVEPVELPKTEERNTDAQPASSTMTGPLIALLLVLGTAAILFVRPRRHSSTA